ncbi:MAG: queuosine precursor transporter, partial [Betaproteobacteria bacterium]
NQAVYETVFGQTPRIVMASLIAYFCGEFANSYTLAKMKILTNGQWLWTRTIGSTVVGEAVDSALFYPLAFYGIFSNELLVTVMITNYLLKTAWEILMTPVTYKVVAFLKKKENEDYYDRDTNFTPFSLKT